MKFWLSFFPQGLFASGPLAWRCWDCVREVRQRWRRAVLFTSLCFHWWIAPAQNWKKAAFTSHWVLSRNFRAWLFWNAVMHLNKSAVYRNLKNTSVWKQSKGREGRHGLLAFLNHLKSLKVGLIPWADREATLKQNKSAGSCQYISGEKECFQ